MKQLPPVFLQTMQNLLADEYAEFMGVYSAPATLGLRANTLKTLPHDLSKRLPYQLSPVPWCPAGFQLPAELEPGLPPPGRHPYHAAGLYYLQEPSAMAVAELLDPQPGERVIDLCAAPGGKSTHLAALMQGEGLLVANETHPKRVWELVENLERWGARNVIVLNENPTRLAKQIPDFFDRVLVDAPCSGEGMFRKSEAALRDWSPELVRSCALRQLAILAEGAQLTRPGGKLVYSTCTFNPQENEQTLARFLSQHPHYEIGAVTRLPGISSGRPDWVKEAHALPLERAVRLWPHLVPGEGHFIAVLRRSLTEPVTTSTQTSWESLRRARVAPQQLAEANKAFAAFCQDYLSPEVRPDFPEDRFRLVREDLYLSPPKAINMEGLRAIRPGWWLGTIRPGEKGRGFRFQPSHSHALGLNSGNTRLALDLEPRSALVLAFLRGEVLEWRGEDGWVLVCVDGYPLGWGRGIQGKLKNHYPRGLRWV